MNNLRKLTIALLVSTPLGCTSSPDTSKIAAALPGQWMLIHDHDCSYGSIKSDDLTLRADGTFDQHLVLPNGKIFDSANSPWAYLPPHNIALDARWDFPKGAEAPVREGESLILEGSNPPVIVLDPDNNCFYEKVSK